MKNIFAVNPEKRKNSDDGILLTTFATNSALPYRLDKNVWLMIMQYLSEKDLSMLMLTTHSFRLSAVESIRRRATMPSVHVGSFFNVRMGFYRILLSQLENKEIAQTIEKALNEPVFQQKVFNKIPTRILAERLTIEPQKWGSFIHLLLRPRNAKELNYIFKNFEALLKLLDEKNITAVDARIIREFRLPNTSSATSITGFM
ncbi:MAG TPA: hypothetical protein VGV92_04460 [Gammaproteobacteria bacterium]|nr:hypothetical protein [Gammaproteobacteria bacterium]